ncbi:mannosyl-oligosaccharide glucosidase-like [Mytilus edulis]|uniref:mannosyl-oligosaccharide glucosidase-like n=1 Tax=Mytilus edulis TaxID=6550 RepID=UPI0039EE237F
MEEKRLFQQLEELWKGPALDACRLNFETRILMGKHLSDFLDDINNKHPLFHQHYPVTPCCKCHGPYSLAAPRKKSSLTKPQFMLLYSDTGSPEPNHELKYCNVVTQFCLCKIEAQKTITVSALDISIIHIIAFRCKSSNKLNQRWLQDIRRVRNELVHVHTNCCVDKTTFDNLWKKLETATLGFASEVSGIFEKYMRKAINDIAKDNSTDDVKVTEVVAELEKSVDKHEKATEERNAKFQSGINGINEKLTSIGVMFLSRIEQIERKLEIRDSKYSLRIPEKTESENQDIPIEIKVNGPISNESQAIDRLKNGSCDDDEEQFKLNYAGRGCILLKMTANREIFKDEESLRIAFRSLTERITKAGEIDTSVKGTLKIVVTLTSPITKAERNILCGMLSRFGFLNETRYELPYTTEKKSSLTVSPDSSPAPNFALTEEQYGTLKTYEVGDEYGSDVIENNGNSYSTVLTSNTTVCTQCNESFECFNCIEKEEIITQLMDELNIKSAIHKKNEIMLAKLEDKIANEGLEQEPGSVHSSRDVLKSPPVKSNSSWLSYFRCNTYFISAIISLFLGILTYNLYDTYLQERNISRVITPLDQPKVSTQTSTTPYVNPQMYWGTYRANLYFGMKTRSPRSPVVGLMWFEEFPGDKKRPNPSLRHWCMPNDNVVRYGWKKHDGKNFGIQEIVDTNFILTTSFIKRHSKDSGGDWSWRISVMPIAGKVQGVVSLLVYVALDDDGKLNPIIERGRLKHIDGSSSDLGDFVFTFPSARKTNKVKYSRLVAQHKGFTNLEDLLMFYMNGDSWNNTHYFTAFRKPKILSKTNIIVHQVSGVLPLEIDIVYETGKFHNKPNPYSMKDEVLTQALKVASQEFDTRFASTFNLQGKGFSLKQVDFAKAGISNLLGEISYFYGSSLVKSDFNEKYNIDPLSYWPAALYTSIPSRTFFPRGFLWNVGFDNLLISLWDPKITEDIIAHWLDLLNNEGWIPREQILGEEARARVPEKFIVQDNKNANPPTIFITLKQLMRRGLTDKQFLNNIFPRLRMMFHWFNTSQAGVIPSTYYWRGRHYETKEQKNPLTPSSGFDDYPRASLPSSHERHLDLRCWMAFASGVMSDIGKKIKKEWQIYEDTHQLLIDNEILDKYHWSSYIGMYSDVGLEKHTKDPNKNHNLWFMNSFGYSSLFPLMLRIIDPDSIRLTKMITDIRRRELLWTNFGLRSLARNSSFYQLPNTGIDPPYWRGSIWINMNYLTLSGLYYYGKTPGKNEKLALDTYKELRNNIISNVIREYSKKGSLFEQYDDQTGEGKGSHPFSGWSALIVAIMAEEY